MNTPIFSQAAIYRLQQLASAVHRQSGMRYRLSKPDNLMALLRYANESGHPEVALYYRAFFGLLSRPERASLQQHGIELRQPDAQPFSVSRQAS